MSEAKLRWLVLAMLATASAGLLGLTSILHSAFAYGQPAPVGIDPPGGNPDVTIADIMGGSGTPIPQQGLNGAYMGDVFDRYLTQNFPSLSFAAPCPAAPCDVNGIFTPEGLYPLTGVNSLPLDTSVSQGVTILGDTIQKQLTTLPAGDDLGIFGYSQSAIISSLEMQDLHKTDPTAPVNFVLIGDIMNPNGGIFERFGPSDLPGLMRPELMLPSLGLDFYGPTPSDDFPTAIYTLEYDGFADFPQYPINFLSDLNAVAGIEFVHGTYPEGGPAGGIGTPVLLDGSAASGTADSLTNYYMIPVNNLPLLDPVRDIPVIGNPVADLLQPDLTYLVNLGYGDPLYGWSTSAANVPTPFGLFPSPSAFEQLPGLLLSGTEQGIQHFIGDLSHLSTSSLSVPSLLDLMNPATAFSAATSPTDIINGISSAASTAYGTLLPTADIANALLTSLPAYDGSLLLDNLSNPLDAIGLPVAADTGLVTLAGGVEFLVILNAAQTIATDFGLGLIP